jgi:hypothetical protein
MSDAGSSNILQKLEDFQYFFQRHARRLYVGQEEEGDREERKKKRNPTSLGQ